MKLFNNKLIENTVGVKRRKNFLEKEKGKKEKRKSSLVNSQKYF